MKFVAAIETEDELRSAARAGASEILLGHRALSRLGGLETAAVTRLAREARTLRMRTVLEWDVLMTEAPLERACATLASLDLADFDAIRVQDPGAYQLALAPPPGLSGLAALGVQLVLESGSHNRRAIRRWCEHGGKRLERVIVSLELPAARVAEIIQDVPTPVELQALGPIALFYTPRHLLSHSRDAADGLLSKSALDHDELRASASCTEDGHSGFRVRETAHGTFLYHAKDYCLLDRVEELRAMGLAAARVDLRLLDDRARAPELLGAAGAVLRDGSNATGEAFKQTYPLRVLRCFFQANATDVLVKRLKNTEIERHDEDFLGRVVEAAKGDYLVIHLLGKGARIKRGDRVRLLTPEGASHDLTIETMTDLDQKPIERAAKGDYVLWPHVKSITAETVILTGRPANGLAG